MRWVLFLARVAQICNFFFMLCLLIRHTSVLFSKDSHEFILIMGWIMSPVLNYLVLLIVLISVAKKRDRIIPRSYLLVTLFFTVLQSIYLFIYRP